MILNTTCARACLTRHEADLAGPWSDVRERYPIGMRIHGKVVSLTDYGAFIELEKGVEGSYVSEMSGPNA